MMDDFGDIQVKTMFDVRFDCHGQGCDRYFIVHDVTAVEDAVKVAMAHGWRFVRGKWYCPKCYSEGNLICGQSENSAQEPPKKGVKACGFDFEEKLLQFEKACQRVHGAHSWKEVLHFRKCKKAVLDDFVWMMEVIQATYLG